VERLLTASPQSPAGRAARRVSFPAPHSVMRRVGCTGDRRPPEARSRQALRSGEQPLAKPTRRRAWPGDAGQQWPLPHRAQARLGPRWPTSPSGRQRPLHGADHGRVATRVLAGEEQAGDRRAPQKKNVPDVDRAWACSQPTGRPLTCTASHPCPAGIGLGLEDGLDGLSDANALGRDCKEFGPEEGLSIGASWAARSAWRREAGECGSEGQMVASRNKSSAFRTVSPLAVRGFPLLEVFLLKIASVDVQTALPQLASENGMYSPEAEASSWGEPNAHTLPTETPRTRVSFCCGAVYPQIAGGEHF
jgi:hypothetical protein